MNRNKLAAAIIENGMTKQQVAVHLGMNPKTFYRKMKRGVFGTDEVQKMIELLNIKNPVEIFLDKE